MIAYFDTSAPVPLVITEPGSATCARLWNEATRVVSMRVIYPEARAALAQAQRMRRLTASELELAVDDLDSIASEISYLEITAELAASAGDLAQTHADRLLSIDADVRSWRRCRWRSRRRHGRRADWR